MNPSRRSTVLRLSAGPDVAYEIERTRSRFLAVLRRVDDEHAARDLVAELRKTHPAARHHCSAFLVDMPGTNRIERSSDDGEPPGTAGTPMLEVLRGSGVTGVCAVVVRWFGGTKLGTGGLVRAYGQSVSGVLAHADESGRIAEVTQRAAWSTEVGHTVAGGLEAALRSAGADILEISYGRRAQFRVAGEPELLNPLLATRTSGGSVWEPEGWVFTERPVTGHNATYENMES